MPPLQQFRVREKLLRIFKMVGATEKLFTTKQIVSYLGKYIEQRKLYDCKNVQTVHCRGDLLEELFGVQVFTIGNFKDVWQFVFPHLIPATNREIEESEAQSKNKQESEPHSSDSGTGKLDHQWMSQLPWWYFVKKDSKDGENHDTATASGSVVATSTAYVVDTEYESDSNDSKATNCMDDRFSEEYEPDSDNSDTDSTEPLESDDEPFRLVPRIRSEQNDETTTTTTTDTTDVSMDYDMPFEDQWRCGECTTLNPFTVGYCQRCWKLRKGWFPDTSLPSPVLTKSFTLPAGEYSESLTPMLERSSSQPVSISRGIDVSDGKRMTPDSFESSGGKDCRTSESSNFHALPFNNCKRKQDSILQENAEPAQKIRNTTKHMLNSDSNASTSKQMQNHPLPKSRLDISEPTSSDSTVQENSSNLTTDRPLFSASFPGLCNICHNNPNDAIIVHGKFGHQYCCYRCAKRLQKKGKTCPVCRQPISSVVKNFICQM